MIEGLNSFWVTPFRITYWKEYGKYSEDIIRVVKNYDILVTKETDSVGIAGLETGLTTKWYSYNFLKTNHPSIQKLREYIFSEVRAYISELGHVQPDLYYQSWANLLENKEVLSVHSHAGPYSYVSGVFFVRTVASSTKYFLPIDRRIPGVEDFYETEIEVENIEGGLVIFPSFIEHCSTPTLDNMERITIAFDILKEAPIDRFHNSFGHQVIDKLQDFEQL